MFTAAVVNVIPTRSCLVVSTIAVAVTIAVTIAVAVAETITVSLLILLEAISVVVGNEYSHHTSIELADYDSNSNCNCLNRYIIVLTVDVAVDYRVIDFGGTEVDV